MSESTADKPKNPGLRRTIFEIIFQHHTPAGKFFDVALLWAILLSVLVVMLESVSSLNSNYGNYFKIAEWVFTILFTLEYFLRIFSTLNPKKYIFSFFGLVDLLSILPAYIAIFFSGGQYFAVIRGLRLLRTFRILKMSQYLGEAEVLMRALKASRAKIIVFLFAVLSLVTIIGAIMHLLEGPESGFTSIPKSVYWAIVTLTTVGYGDIAPQSIAGQTLAAFVMIMGYAIIAVPTGIVSVEMSQAFNNKEEVNKDKISGCEEANHQKDAHEKDAKYCKYCGKILS